MAGDEASRTQAALSLCGFEATETTNKSCADFIMGKPKTLVLSLSANLPSPVIYRRPMAPAQLVDHNGLMSVNEPEIGLEYYEAQTIFRSEF